MKYEPDFADACCVIGLLGICTLSILATYVCLRWLQRLDEEVAIRKCEIGLCILNGELVFIIGRMWIRGGMLENTIAPKITLVSVIGGCLLAACIMDMESCMIYNYVWLVAGAATITLLYVGTKEKWWELAAFVLLQELLFARMYGRADCHAFVVCAATEAALGMSMQAFLFHMMLAFGMLAIVQGVRGNVGKNGNLKCAVPFLPYITVSFWSVMALYGIMLLYRI